MANRLGNDGNSDRLGAPKSLQMVTAAMRLKTACSLKKNYDQTRHHTKKQRHYFANKGPFSQGYGFSSGHVWNLDYKESWAPKNWCFQIVVLEKTLESPLDSQKIKPVNPKGNQPWTFIGMTDAEAEAPVPWPPGAKNWLIRKRPYAGKIEGRRRGWKKMRCVYDITNLRHMNF